MTDHPNWKALSTVDFSWKCFVKGSEEIVESNKSAGVTCGSVYKHALTGDEAKQLYDDVVQLCHNSHDRPKSLGLHEEKSCDNTGTPTLGSTSISNTGFVPVSVCDKGALFSQFIDIHGDTKIPKSASTVGLKCPVKDGSSQLERRDRPTEAAIGLQCIGNNSSEQNVKLMYEKDGEPIGFNSQTLQTERILTPILSKHVPNISYFNYVMKEAQTNNVQCIRKYIEDGMDINAIDNFGWTILMVAVCAGAEDVVQLLLKYGANVHVKDKSGYSCHTLAKRHGHLHIVDILDNYKQTKHKVDHEKQNRSIKPRSNSSHELNQTEDFYCHICKRSFCETTQEKHLSSTVHLFNSRPQSMRTIYGIPESNVGYQILLKRGWDRESGLGPDGTGQKFPCKTVLKQDRKGLGVRQPKPRVTHFEPKEEAAVKHVHAHKTEQSNKKSLKKLINYEKHKERRLRNELS